MVRVPLLCGLVLLCASCATLAPGVAAKGVQPLPGDSPVPRVTVSLDDPPATRWNRVIAEGHFDFAPMIDFITNLVPKALLPLLEKLLGDLDNYLGAPWAAEVRGMANATGLELGWVVVYNLFYEITAFCTSVVAQHPNGTVFHARNLDYGVPGLRNVTIDVSFTKDGKELFRTVTYAGYVGALTGMRPGGFSVSVDERDTQAAFPGVLYNAFEALFEGGKSIGFTLRDLLEQQTSFDGALGVLSGAGAVHLIAPVYVIVGGARPGEGAVVTRDRNRDSHLWRLGDNGTAVGGGTGPGSWYVLETNYDWWAAPGDGRRAAAEKSMAATTAAGVGVPALWEALSTPPVLNKGTTYTAMMSAEQDIMFAATRRFGQSAPPPE